ncbi:MAG: hypothetical protein OXF86_07605 [Caldilineaceae bacterium]|nr:hypothetical protein [Caldilineaceae bacterium]
MTRRQSKVRIGWLVASVSLFLFLAAYQLGLPGLHYDEAKEAGVNAMELLHGTQVTAFRDATVSVFGLDLPLMVQDYIGALNVYLALPILAATGIGVPNLRLLPLTLAVLGMLALERSVSEWLALSEFKDAVVAPIYPAALACLTLLAAAPSFVFWQRQGIFVTNATFPLTFACIWLAIRWFRLGQGRALILSALCGGLAVYAKLLAAWIVLPFGTICALWWLWHRGRHALRAVEGEVHRNPLATRSSSKLSWLRHLRPSVLPLAAALAFALPLFPLILFNLKTGGTLTTVTQNLGSSYYGVDNAAIWTNASVRWQQLLQTLRGDHFWYLGAVEQNAFAPWLTLVLPAVALSRPAGRRVAGPPLLLLAAAFAASLFTVSDLFVTHYALLHPLVIAVTGVALHELWRSSAPIVSSETSGARLPDGTGGEVREKSRIWATERLRALASRYRMKLPIVRMSPLQLIFAIFVCAGVLLDLRATAAYHGALTRSGGLVDHSDASYHLAYDLRHGSMGAPIVLDWGMEAPVRFLSEGSVRPVEVFGYSSLSEPDGAFIQRIEPFLQNVDNVYLLRAPGNELFRGRREAFERIVKERSGRLELEKVYAQQDGTPLYERWRVLH